MRRPLPALFAVVALTAVPPAAADDPAADPLAHGRQVYVEGTSPTGDDPTAVMGEAGIEVPAAAIPCASCHGRDGRGRPEGGVVPTDVTWEALTNPHGGESATGRHHPAYDRDSLLRAITLGVDPAGNELDVAMPRYRLSKEDADALVEFVTTLGEEAEPGVTDHAVVVGTLLPPPELEGAAAVVEGVLRALLGEVASEGGVYGRRIELVTARAGTSPAQSRQRLEDLLDRERPFALVAPFFAGAGEELAGLAEARAVPVIGPVDPAPDPTAEGSGTVRPHVFHLVSGPLEQARVLTAFAAGRLPGGLARWAVMVPPQPGEEERTALAGLERQAGILGLPAPPAVAYGAGAFDAPALVARLRAAEVEHLFLLGGGLELARFLAEAARASWAPAVYLPAPGTVRALLDGAAAGTGFEGPVHAAFPLLPRAAGASAKGRQRIARLGAEAGLPPGQETLVQRTLAASDLLVEGLRQTGHRLTREALVDRLGHLFRHPTGLVPPLTYHPNRRIGALGAYVVTFDAAGRSPDTSPGWQALEAE